MLTLQFIRENREAVVAGLEKKYFKDAAQVVEALIAADEERRRIQQDSEALSAEGNQIARQVGELMKQGQGDQAQAAKARSTEIKEQVRMLSEQLSGIEERIQGSLVLMPNLPHESVPQGRTADENIVAKEWGTKPQLPDNAQPHWELIKKLNIIDFELGNKITGAGFPVYRGKGAKLQRALIQFFLDKATEAGYEEIQPPILINKDSGFGTGQLPDKEGQMYHATADDLYLIPTAEVPITNIYRDVILEPGQLPIKNAGYTPCFRREAGSWGAHVRGLNRLHQFDKVEIVQICLPEHSYDIQEVMCAHVEALLTTLELPWRKLLLSSGDMSFASARTFDYEVWSAAQERWLEVSSVSNFETFQANRLKLRYRTAEKKTALAHTLNGSAMALPRVVAALLENNQQTDGSIRLPGALVKYTGFETITV